MPEDTPTPPPSNGPEDSQPASAIPPSQDTPIFKPPRMEHVTAGREPGGVKRTDRDK